MFPVSSKRAHYVSKFVRVTKLVKPRCGACDSLLNLPPARLVYHTPRRCCRSTVKGATVGLGKILGSCWVLTYITLVLSNPRFQPMIDPTFEAPSADTAAAAAAKTIAGGSRGNHPGTVDDTTALSTCGDTRFGNRGCESPQASRTDRDSGVGFWRHSRHGLGWPFYRVKSTDARGVEGEVSPDSVAKRRGRDAIYVPLVRGGTGRSNWL